MQGRFGELARRYSWVGYVLVPASIFFLVWIHRMELREEEANRILEEMGENASFEDSVWTEVWLEFAFVIAMVLILMGGVALIRDAFAKDRGPRAGRSSTPPG